MSLILKKKVLEACKSLLKSRIAEAKKVMDQFQEAANSETKSTAGDKHETSRAMMQADREKAAMQLSNNLKYAPLLNKLNADLKLDKIAVGALVQTDQSWFFLAVPLGGVEVDGEEIMVVSPVAPISKLMLGKSVGDVFAFNRNSYKIKAVF